MVAELIHQRRVQAAAIAGEALVQCLIDRGITGGSILLPSDTAMGNIEVNTRVNSAYNAIVASLEKNGILANFQVDAGPENVGVPVTVTDTHGKEVVRAVISMYVSPRKAQ